MVFFPGRVSHRLDIRRWERGPIFGVSTYGQGYCYLELFKPQVRIRVARLLGPFPYVADVQRLFNFCGTELAHVSFKAVIGSVYHVDVGCRMQGHELLRELCDIVADNPDARIGADGPSVLSDDFMTSVEVKPLLSSKGYCDVCGFVVVKEGHVSRCRKPDVVDKVRAFVGDALQAVDVKVALAASGVSHAEITDAAKVFLSGSAQAGYMREFYPVVVAGLNVRQCSNRFEAAYCADFRERYVHWMLDRVGVAGVVDPEGYMRGGVRHVVEPVGWLGWLRSCFGY